MKSVIIPSEKLNFSMKNLISKPYLRRGTTPSSLLTGIGFKLLSRETFQFCPWLIFYILYINHSIVGIVLFNLWPILLVWNILTLKHYNIGNKGNFPGADTGGGGHSSPPPEFGIFCSYFQNSFSIACLRERNPSAKQERHLS